MIKIIKQDNIKISGIAVAAPGRWVSIDEFIPDLGSENIEKFKKNTGITGRYEASQYQTASDICFSAASRLLEEKQISAKEIEAIIFISQTPDYIAPATACVLQHRLQMPKESIAFDINLGCSGFVYGISILSGLMQSLSVKNALLLCGDTSVRERSPKEKLVVSNTGKLLFRDAGCAVLMQTDADASPIISSLFTDGSGFRILYWPGLWRNPEMPMVALYDDTAVFSFSINEAPKALNSFMKTVNKTAADYDYLVLHQANLFILKQIAKKTGFPMEKVPIGLDTFANCSSASIPTALVRNFGDFKEDRKLHLLMSGFGVGLSWGVVDMSINTSDILPLINTDDYFIDGMEDKNQ
ncbi:MAG: ketoacyl-ACP synthase III [Flexilinea sp.]